MKRFLFIGMFILLACGSSFGYQASVSVPNGTGAQVRTNLNNALQAVSTSQSGAGAPSTTYAYQSWIDTSTTPPTWKIRNSANTAWVSIGTINDTGPVFFATNATSATNATNATNASGAGNVPATRYENGLRIVRGTLITNSFSNPTIDSGSGFTVTRAGVGIYTITFTNAFSAKYSIVSSTNQLVYDAKAEDTSLGAASITYVNTSGTPVDTSSAKVYFFAIGPN